MLQLLKVLVTREPRHPLKALVGKRSVPMDRHLLQVLVTREPRQLLKIHMGIEIMVTRDPMIEMSGAALVMEMLDMLVIMGLARLDMVGTLRTLLKVLPLRRHL